MTTLWKALIAGYALISGALLHPNRASALDCRNGFPYQGGTYGIASVIASDHAYFYAAAPPCPDGPGCRMSSYIEPGDLVITGPAEGSGLCALYPGQTRTIFGVIHRTDLGTPQPADTHPPLTAWTGTWKKGDDQITLRPDGSSIVANGDAYWPSANPPLDQQPGGPNIGEMAGKADPNGNAVTFASTDPNNCRVTLTLVSPFMLAQDNNKCGGHNVTFTGVYLRPPPS
jgi:hypothetical protein